MKAQTQRKLRGGILTSRTNSYVIPRKSRLMSAIRDAEHSIHRRIIVSNLSNPVNTLTFLPSHPHVLSPRAPIPAQPIASAPSRPISARHFSLSHLHSALIQPSNPFLHTTLHNSPAPHAVLRAQHRYSRSQLCPCTIFHPIKSQHLHFDIAFLRAVQTTAHKTRTHARAFLA